MWLALVSDYFLDQFHHTLGENKDIIDSSCFTKLLRVLCKECVL